VHFRTLCHPFNPVHLLGAIHDLLATVVPPNDTLTRDVEKLAAALAESEFRECLAREIEACTAGTLSKPLFLASVRLHELKTYRSRLTPVALAAINRQLLELVHCNAIPADIHGRGSDGELLMLLPDIGSQQARDRLRLLSDRIARHIFRLPGQQTTFTPIIGYARLSGPDSVDSALAKAAAAAADAALRLDLQPAFHRPAAKRRRPGPPWSWLIRLASGFDQRRQIWVQFVVTLLLGMGFPYLVYYALGALGWDITHGVYMFVVSVLVLTALSIWAEGLLALRPMHPPDEPARPYPIASAIIAAYLPNEAPIIEATIEAFLRVQYPASLQVILAYNTPADMAIEARLQQIAAAHPNFIPMRIQGSTSKAQNVNAALPYATGEFTAVFDADHQPDPDSFRRAWRWLSHGADVVQGHCLIRNGDASWVARMIAIEFEQIYAVNHPGRARLHGFGIFGGSNGYWRTDLLRQLRMHGFMLTEDIDSSLRAVIGGRKIVSDPYLVSRELAPETMGALVKQRLRWAQGWFQISMKWILPALRSPRLNLRQKLGMLQLLVLREAFPWVSMQIVPLVAYWAVQAGSLWRLDWLVPLFVVTTLFTLSTGPGQILFTYRLADPQIKQHRRWFLFYLWTSTLFYSGLKNAWNRIAHIKEAMGETTWNVTVRTSVKKK
jgi:cellulose synthase/poly-beta-1,6-N-acetylglucosamine synthase-like glycosyltransferase